MGDSKELFLTHPSGLRMPLTLAERIQREGVVVIPPELIRDATPEQARALLALAGYAANHPLFRGRR